MRETGDVAHSLHHGVDRVADDDDDGVGAGGFDLFANGADDAGVDGKEVVAAHARLTSDARGDDDDVAVRGISVIGGAGQVGSVTEDGSGFGKVKSFTLGHISRARSIEKNDVSQPSLSAI